jgi:hypothetical protein
MAFPELPEAKTENRIFLPIGKPNDSLHELEIKFVMPDLIRHPERIEFTGFRLLSASGGLAGMTVEKDFRLFMRL